MRIFLDPLLAIKGCGSVTLTVADNKQRSGSTFDHKLGIKTKVADPYRFMWIRSE